MSMAYIRRHYGVPAKRGMRVTALGDPGVITGSNDARLRIRLDGHRHAGLYHPTWRITYPGWRPADQLETRDIVTVELPGISR